MHTNKGKAVWCKKRGFAAQGTNRPVFLKKKTIWVRTRKVIKTWTNAKCERVMEQSRIYQYITNLPIYLSTTSCKHQSPCEHHLYYS